MNGMITFRVRPETTRAAAPAPPERQKTRMQGNIRAFGEVGVGVAYLQTLIFLITTLP